MFKRILSVVLVGLLFNSAAVRARHISCAQEDEQARLVKEAIRKLGVGEDAHVEIELRSRQKMKGYILEAGRDHFTLADEKSGNRIR